VIFIDSSAIYAMADRADSNHGRSQRLFEQLLVEQQPLSTHNYVVVESLALIQNRLGLAAAKAFEKSLHNFRVVWIDEETHDLASARWAKGRRTLSFVDHVSFVVMERFGITTAFAFGSDFVGAGFNILSATRRP
jgi:predicted nucleic acid-binding protein